MIKFGLQPYHASAICNCIELRSLVQGKLYRLSQCIWDDQDVRKQNCRIETKSTDRLKRRFSRELRRETELKKISGFLTQLSIFRQIAAGLSHQPDRRRTATLAIENIEKRFCHSNIPT